MISLCTFLKIKTRGVAAQILKKIDLLLIAFFILLAISLVFIFAIANSAVSTVAAISVDGAQIFTINIEQNESEAFTIVSPNGINEILVEGGMVRMIYANCPDQYCLRMGAISGIFQTIVCLPNRVIVEIQNTHYNYRP